MSLNHGTNTRKTGEPASQESSARMASQAVIVVPTLNPGPLAPLFTQAVLDQRPTAARIIVLDSESTDGSAAFFEAAGFEVVRVARRTFDHGATRNLALTLAPGAELIVFMTQDAILRPGALANLLLPFADPAVALVYGRQIARSEAGAVERHARLFNYPSASARRTLQSASGAGIKAVFNSNSFAAYRRSALEAAGGFPEGIIFGEDQVAAGRLLLAGWTICYEASAQATHSHSYSPVAEFHRYFDHGVAHAQQSWLLKRFGTASGAGVKFVRSELKYLLREAPLRMPEAVLRTFLKFGAYKLGRNESRLPAWLKRRLSLQQSFFDDLTHRDTLTVRPEDAR